MTYYRKNLFAAGAGLVALVLLASAAAALGPGRSGGSGGSGGGNPPATQPAPGAGPGDMMGNGMMGDGMMGNVPAVPPPACPGTGGAAGAPCGNQGEGGMPMPRGQTLPQTQ